MASEGGGVSFLAGISAALGRMYAPRWVSMALMAATIVCAMILGWLVYQTTLTKDAALWGKAVVFIIGMLAMIATALVSWQPGECSTGERIASPFGAALLLVAVFGAFGTMTDALSMFAPRPATQADTTAIRDDIRELNTILREQFPDSPPVLETIAGRWGEQEPACGLVWEIAVIESGGKAALTADMVVRPAGAQPFKLLAEIVDAKGQSMTISGIEPASARGSMAVLSVNPATGRLTWDDKAKLGGVEEYRRCPAD